MKKFPFEHVVRYDTQEVWVKCSSSVTAMGLGVLVNQYYPRFSAKIASEEYFETLTNQIVI